MKPLKTIVLKDKAYTFNDALVKLLNGECIGIKPNENTGYIELFKPKWMNQESKDYFLRWYDHGRNCESNTEIRTNQFIEPWYLVVVDHIKIRGTFE